VHIFPGNVLVVFSDGSCVPATLTRHSVHVVDNVPDGIVIVAIWY